MKYENSASKLTRHLERKHGEIWDSEMRKKAEIHVKENTLDKFISYGNKYEESVLEWIVTEYEPLSSVDRPSFRKMIASISPRSEYIISSGSLRDMIRKRASASRAILKVSLQAENLAISFDCWTSNAAQSYLGVTAHYIDSDWVIRKVAMQCKTLITANSTAEDIHVNILSALSDFDISISNITAFVTDTEPTMNKYGRLIKEGKHSEWIGCICHILEICTGKVMGRTKVDNVADVLQKARRLVSVFKHSTQKMDMLLAKQPEGQKLKVLQDVETRWWSVYTMIERLIQLRPYISILAQENSIVLDISYMEWSLLEELKMVLEPFMSAQYLLEGEKYVTISLVPKIISRLRNNMKTCLQQLEGKSLGFIDVLKEIYDQFCKEWGDGTNGTVTGLHKSEGYRLRQVGLQPIHMIAAALDPRTKDLSGIPKIERDHVWKKVQDAVIAHTGHQQNNNNEILPTRSSKSESTKSKRDQMFHIDDEDDDGDDNGDDGNRGDYNKQSLGASDIKTSVLLELASYRALSALSFDSNPLTWWKERSMIYPLLAACARKYLAVPASSAPVERLFSCAGLTVTKKRAALKPSLVNDIVFLHESWDTLAETEAKTLKRIKLVE